LATQLLLWGWMVRAMTRLLLGLVFAMTWIGSIWAQAPQQQFPVPQGQVQGLPPGQAPPGQVPPGQLEANGDAPEHGVARLSVVEGNVSVRQADNNEQSAAAVNGPLMKDDLVVTGENSRAEVQFDANNFVRVAPGSEVRFGEVQYHNYAIQVAAGTATYRVLHDSDAQVEISLPQVSARPTRQGAYRVTVMPDGTSSITVLQGEGEVYSSKGSEKITVGQTMMVRGSENDPEFQTVNSPALDEWDHWNEQRDQQLQRAVSPRYVSPDVYGTEDLDPYGSWQYDQQYGNVWIPRVGPDWAPYREGRWVWQPFYGWTWVSTDPWGWAPYHYGRWFYGGRGWAWYPGPIAAHYYYRPALVGFFGWGTGFGSSIGFGFGYANVGWVPLAPYEVYRPWYGRGFYNVRGGAIVNNVRIVNNVNVTNVYRNAGLGRGITSVRSGDFGHGAIHGGNFVRASMTDVARGGEIRGAMPIAPSRDSFRMSDRSVATRGMPSVNQNAQFFSRSNPSRSNPVNGANTFRGDANGVRNENRINVGGGAVNSPRTNQGWRRLDNPGGQSVQNGSANRSDLGAQNQNRGWQRLDTPNNSQNGFRGNEIQNNRIQGSQNPQIQNNQPRQLERNGQPPRQTYSQQERPAQNYTQQPRNFQPQPAPQQQSVRISPPIVRERGSSGGGPDVHGGFGGAHAGGGGGGSSRPSGGNSGGGGSHGGNSGGHSNSNGRGR
jgi:hypothetical protein